MKIFVTDQEGKTHELEGIEGWRVMEIIKDYGLPMKAECGGCLACGEPIGASGLRQVYENVMQLRGQAGGRQVPKGPRIGYSQVYGAPGISAVCILGGA